MAMPSAPVAMNGPKGPAPKYEMPTGPDVKTFGAAKPMAPPPDAMKGPPPALGGRPANGIVGGFGGGAAPPAGMSPATLPPAPSPTKLPGAGGGALTMAPRPAPTDAWGRPMAPKAATPWGAGSMPVR